MFIISTLLSLLLPVLIIGTIVYLIVRRRDGDNGITTYSAMITYFYFVTGASIITVSTGASYVLFAILRSFYSSDEEIADETTLGLTLLVTGTAVLLLHILERRKAQNLKNKSTLTIRRVYLFFMLAACSLTGIISLPLAINETIRYHIEDSGNRDDPSGLLAVVAIAVVPLWIYFLGQSLKETRGAKSDLSADCCESPPDIFE